ncbi:uncharacterized protein AB9W97_021913 [Spinachia spinachia]
MANCNGKGEKGSKFETLKLLEKCRKERDDAMQREGVLREKLRQCESKLRSSEAVRQKVKTLIMDNRELRKQVKALRTEIGLECSPKFNGKTTKDIVNELQEKDRECSYLLEKSRKLNLTIDDLTSELANTVTSKTLLEDQAQSLQQNLKDMTNNQRRLLKLWEDKKVRREQVALPAIVQKPAQKPFNVHKAVQTEMSVSSSQRLPVNAFGSKLFSRDLDQTTLDKHSLPTYGNGYHRDEKAFTHDETEGIKKGLDSMTDIH